MGWEVQGYYKNPGEEHASWHVECSGDEIDEIEKYNGVNPLPIQHEPFGEIYYGNKGLEIFRGFSTIKDNSQIQYILNQFTNLPVYADKWLPSVKRFYSTDIIILELEQVLIFYDKKEQNIDLIKKALQDLTSRLEEKGLIKPFDITLIKQLIEGK